jgi:hypothetical protein
VGRLCSFDFVWGGGPGSISQVVESKAIFGAHQPQVICTGGGMGPSVMLTQQDPSVSHDWQVQCAREAVFGGMVLIMCVAFVVT